MARVGARINELVRFKSKSWLGAESNRRHVDFQSTALPTELPSRKSRVSLSSNAGWSLKQKTLNAQTRLRRRRCSRFAACRAVASPKAGAKRGADVFSARRAPKGRRLQLWG